MLAALAPAALLLLSACAGAPGRLTDDDPQVRSMALDGILRSGEPARRKAALRMKKILARGETPYDLYAASALEDLGQSAAPAVPELMAALTGQDTDVSLTAGRALSKLDAAAPALLEALKSPDAALRREAAIVLPAQGSKAAPALAKNLSGDDPALAEESARILGEMGPAAKDAVPALAKAAYSGPKEIKGPAAAALSKIGPPAGKWLAAALKTSDPKTRAAAAAVLAEMTPPSPEAAVPLSEALNAPEGTVSAGAARALSAYPAETQMLFPENFLSALFRAAQSEDGETRRWACITLSKTGAAGGKWLANALAAPEPATRAAAARVLVCLSPPPREAETALRAAAKDADKTVRSAAAAALAGYTAAYGGIKPSGASKSSGEALITALSRGSLEEKRTAAAALGGLGRAGGKAIPALRAALKNRDCALRALAAKALMAIDPAFKRNIAAVRAAKATCHAEGKAPRSRVQPTLDGRDLSETYSRLDPVTPGSSAPVAAQAPAAPSGNKQEKK